MKQKEVFKKIGGIIQELNDQYAYLQTATDDLNDLELELFVSNAHFLTDHIEILCKLNLQKSSVKKPVEKQDTSEKKYFEPVVQQMKQAPETKVTKSQNKTELIENAIPAEEQPVAEIDLSSGVSEDSYSFIREEPETIRHELVLDESLMEDDDEEYLPEEIITAEEPEEIIEDTKAVNETETIPSEKEEVKPDVKEKAAEPKNELKSDEEPVTINQKMSAQLEDKIVGLDGHLKPISDIKLAITLNDKLLFVKDLFNGYNLAYSEAIEILNRFNTFEEASRFLNTNYVAKNNWEGKPATTEKFYALLRRRYA